VQELCQRWDYADPSARNRYYSRTRHGVARRRGSCTAIRGPAYRRRASRKSNPANSGYAC